MNPIQSELHAEIQPDPPRPDFPSSALAQKVRRPRHAPTVTTDTARLTMHRISLAELREQAGMMLANWNEVRRDSPLSFEVAWEAYEQIRPKIVGVFDGDRMVGYAAGFVSGGLQTRHSLRFQVEVIYLSPAYRAAGVASRLLTELLDGVDPSFPVVCHATVGSPAEAFLVRQGFREMERVFIRPGSAPKDS